MHVAGRSKLLMVSKLELILKSVVGLVYAYIRGEMSEGARGGCSSWSCEDHEFLGEMRGDAAWECDDVDVPAHVCFLLKMSWRELILSARDSAYPFPFCQVCLDFCCTSQTADIFRQRYLRLREALCRL